MAKKPLTKITKLYLVLTMLVLSSGITADIVLQINGANQSNPACPDPSTASMIASITFLVILATLIITGVVHSSSIGLRKLLRRN
jgi:hypothetical protein